MRIWLNPLQPLEIFVVGAESIWEYRATSDACSVMVISLKVAKAEASPPFPVLELPLGTLKSEYVQTFFFNF